MSASIENGIKETLAKRKSKPREPEHPGRPVSGGWCVSDHQLGYLLPCMSLSEQELAREGNSEKARRKNKKSMKWMSLSGQQAVVFTSLPNNKLPRHVWASERAVE